MQKRALKIIPRLKKRKKKRRKKQINKTNAIIKKKKIKILHTLLCQNQTVKRGHHPSLLTLFSVRHQMISNQPGSNALRIAAP